MFFLSGDRHLAELSMMDAGVGYPIYDLTVERTQRGRHGRGDPSSRIAIASRR